MLKKKGDHKSFIEEKKLFQKFLYSESNEDAKRHLLYPLFQKLNKEKFKIESDACGADVYIEGQIIVESKTTHSQWLEGFYQALHYHKKHGLAYSIIVVVAHKFVGIWRVNKLPKSAVFLSHISDANIAPNEIGRENARKTSNSDKSLIKDSAIYWLEPKDLAGNYFAGESKSIEFEVYEIVNILKNAYAERQQMNTHNFIEHIELLKKYFDNPIDAVHCFYSIVAYWDITSVISTNEYSDKIQVVGFKGQKHSEEVTIKASLFKDFKKFVESRYIFTNEGSGLTIDYYFGRFDEVMARIDSEYVRQHGIFFTDINLSKFALWFAKEKMAEQLDEKYIWFDPAGGSGNLISSWRGKLKHKIISELQPDLLRIIERRMRIDPWHVDTGFTIIPKTSENKGLNFLDCNASHYLSELEIELQHKNLTIDKPLAFLLNPPYKNTKENVKVRIDNEANYEIHESIISLTGEEAIKERYLAFLGQILNISFQQNKKNELFSPLVMIFTPTSWLFPRPAFVNFREKWDRHFIYISGFIITSNEFFKVDGKWPLAFTIWKYNYTESGNLNKPRLFDYTKLIKASLNINWNLDNKSIEWILSGLLNNNRSIDFSINQSNIRNSYGLKLYDFIRTPTLTEKKMSIMIGGLPKGDERRKNEKTYGKSDGFHIGFMDNGTPVRIKARGDLDRFSILNLRSIWFRLDTAFKDINKAKCFNGATDTRSYCANDFETAKQCCTWFAISRSLVGVYPTWANQSDIWSPIINSQLEKYWHSLCFAFVLAENRCIVTKFEKDNPISGAPEIFVDNPLCPTNPDSFWSITLDKEISEDHTLATYLVGKIKELYKTWNLKYCKGQFLQHVGLQDEPYFKYFSYPDFLTPYSGLIQIRKYAELNNCTDLIDLFSEIQVLSKKVKEEIYRILVQEFKYFE